jgi:hypothetical protein
MPQPKAKQHWNLAQRPFYENSHLLMESLHSPDLRIHLHRTFMPVSIKLNDGLPCPFGMQLHNSASAFCF